MATEHGWCGKTIESDTDCSSEGEHSVGTFEVSRDAEGEYRKLLSANPLPEGFGALVNAFANRSFAVLANDCGTVSENTVYSPLSLLYAIGMLISASQKDTAKQIRLELQRCTGFPSIAPEVLERGFETLSSHLASNPCMTVEAANSVWLNGENGAKPPSNAVIEALEKVFGAEALGVSFGSPAATEAIRAWVSEKTHGKLEPSVETSPDMVALLVNSLYAKMSWTHGFCPEDTDWGDFHIDESTKGDAKFMHAWLSDQRCLVTDDLTRVALPCEGGGCVDFLMPTDGSSLEDLLGDSSALEAAFDAADNRHADIDFALPKFDIRSDLDLKSLVGKLRMGGVFKLQKDCPLVGGAFQVSDIQQGAVVAVDETGLEGAAYTLVDVCTGLPDFSELETIEITFDHPFVFRVRTDEGIPLFMGAVVDPTIPGNKRFFGNPENEKLRQGKGDPAHRIAEVFLTIGGYFQGYASIRIRRSGTGGASCTTTVACTNDRDGERSRSMDGAAFNKLCTRLRDYGAFAWEAEYDEPVLDGEQWRLQIEDVDGATFQSCGSNGYPEGFDAVYQLFVGAGLPEVER